MRARLLHQCRAAFQTVLDRAQLLPHRIVQLARDALALHLLRGDQLPRQRGQFVARAAQCLLGGFTAHDFILQVTIGLAQRVAELKLRRTPSLQAQPPGPQGLLELAGGRAAVCVQYIVQPAPEYVGDRAQIPTLAHAVDAQHLPAAIQQADEVRKRIDRAFPLELGARNGRVHARRMRRRHGDVLAGLPRAFTAHENSALYQPTRNFSSFTSGARPLQTVAKLQTGVSQWRASPAIRRTTIPRWARWICPATCRTDRQTTGGRQAPSGKPTIPSTTCSPPRVPRARSLHDRRTIAPAPHSVYGRCRGPPWGTLRSSRVGIPRREFAPSLA